MKNSASTPFDKRPPVRFYRSDLGDYMHRWIFQHPWGTIRVHHILRSDTDRDPHDHPFDFVSLILTQGYLELTPCPHPEQHVGVTHEKCRWSSDDQGRHMQFFPPFSLNWKKAEDQHILILQKPVWTLVVTGPKQRVWGFHTKDGFVPWQDYAKYQERNV